MSDPFSVATRGLFGDPLAAATRGYLEVVAIVEVPAGGGGSSKAKRRKTVTRRIPAPIPETRDELIAQILREDEELIAILTIAMRVLE